MFDTKQNIFEDVLPLAHNVRGRPNDAKRFFLQQKMISASTAHESDPGSGNEDEDHEESEENDNEDDDVIDEENYMEQDDNRPSLESRFQQLNQMGSNTDSEDSGDQSQFVANTSSPILKIVKRP